MKLLLDTHTFIWWDSDPSKLSLQVLTLCQDPANQLVVSVVSIWEMQIKVHLGKMNLALPLTDLVDQQLKTNNIYLLPVTLAHVLRLGTLPLHHKDPFDRLLVAQAIEEDATILSRDAIFASYPTRLVW
jgi:PIN domain nuclease of toxin-antitoxin system